MQEYGAFKFGQRTEVPDAVGALLVKQGIAQQVFL